jgi:hypothetical protein
MSSNGDSTATFKAIADIIEAPNLSLSNSVNTANVSTFYNLCGIVQAETAINAKNNKVLDILIFLVII